MVVNLNPLPMLGAAASRVVTKSVLNSLLWTLAISFMGVFVLSFVVPPEVKPYLSLMPAVAMLMIFWWYGYFAIRDPSKLLSEEHQHRQAMLPFIGDHLKIASNKNLDLTPVPNPETDQIAKAGGGASQP